MEWINVNNELPPNNNYVLIHLNKCNWHDNDDPNNLRYYKIAKFVRGITKEYRQKNNIAIIRGEDEDGNNLKPYRWIEFGPGSYFGQEVDFWMQIPPLKKEK